MFTEQEINSITDKMVTGYNDIYGKSATRKLLALRKMMQDAGIKEVKILL